MPDYEKAAERAAKKYGLNPAIFKAQLRQESGLKPGLTSSAGAQGIAQFMPATAKQYGVNLNDGRVSDDLDGAARYMRDNLDRTGDDYKAALSIYNSGRPDAYKDPNFAGGQTYDYVRSIMGAAKVKAPKAAAPKKTSTPAVKTVTTPGVDNSGLRRQLVGEFLQQGGVKNQGAVLALAGQYGQAQDVPGTPTTATYGQPQAQPKVKATPKNVGAQAALDWAESKVGRPGSRETGGENHGQLADYANSRFGMTGQPWCAMFTSLAVTKGGAPKVARTASVQEVRRQAEQGGGGYQRGFINPARAKAGDLILFDNEHIGMVKNVEGGQVRYVGGNQSDDVTVASVPVGRGDIVRPKYGARR